MTQSDYLVKQGVTRALVRFSVPVLLATLLQVLYSAVDLLVLGHFATTADVSGAAVSSQIVTTVTLGVSGVTTGVTVLLGQYAGAKNEEEMRKTLGTSVIVFGALAVVLTAALLLTNRAFVSVMRTPAEAVIPARRFLLVSSAGTVFIMGYNLTSSIFRGLGDSKTPLLFVAAACFVNIALNLVFIPVLHMGAGGAALATVSAQAVSLLISLFYLFKRGIGIRMTRPDFRCSPEHLKKLLVIGLPISTQEILVNISFMLITAVINKMGVVASASAGTVETIIGFLMMPTMAVSASVAAMSAHNIGAGEYGRARKTLWTGIGLSLAAAVVLCALSWLRGEFLTGLFSKNPAVIRQAGLYLRSYSLDCLAVSFVFNFNSYFSSCGKSLFAMAHSLLTTFCIRVPFVVTAGGLPGVSLFTLGCAAPLSSLGSIILCLLYFYYLRRKQRTPGAVSP